MDEITHQSKGQRGAFVIARGGETLAQLMYSRGGDIVILDHTEVDDRLRGTGAGARLVKAAVEWARQEKVQLMPLCPFARSVFEKNAAYGDVLKK